MIVLYYMEGYDVYEVAKLMGVTKARFAQGWRGQGRSCARIWRRMHDEASGMAGGLHAARRYAGKACSSDIDAA
ncbi:MAG: hypothetical protein ACLVB5_00560 [Christensenellales bacterium]